MELGPFNVMEVESLTAFFNSKNVPFEVVIDKAAEEELLANHNKLAATAPRASAGRLDLKIIYFEISDQDYDKVAAELENYGITKFSDGSFELGED